MTFRMRAIWKASLAMVLLSPDAAHADERDADLARLRDGTPFEVTLSTPETGETFHRESMRDLSLGMTLQACFAADGHGAFHAVIRLPGADKPLTLRSSGPAEDFYLVYAHKLDAQFAKWYGKASAAVVDSPDVVLDPDEHATLRPKGIVDPVPLEYLQAVAAAAVKYEEKRPELVLRARRRPHTSRLFFPPAAKAGWIVRRDGDRLAVSASCVDRMYVAIFDVEFRKVPGGWEYVRLHAREEFKGE